MPNVKIGVTKKRVNSTSQTFQSSTTLSCKLKEPCSMQSPIFEVQGLSKGTLYNYAQFEGRYYWVDDVVYITNDIQEIHCHIDVLATWKTAIGNTDALIQFSDKLHRSGRIDDPRFNPETQPTHDTPLITSADAFDGITWDAANGTIVMRVMSMPDAAAQLAGHQPGIVTYAMSLTEFAYCLADLTQAFEDLQPSQWGTTIDAIASEFSNLICGILGILGGSGSWRDNILSAIYLPIDKGSFSSYATASATDMIIGNQLCDIYQRTSTRPYIIPSSGVYVQGKQALTIPWWDGTHAGQSSNPPYFLRLKKYCAMQMLLPGTYLDIDTTDLMDQLTLGYYSCINLCTGDWSCKVTEHTTDTDEVLGSASGNVGRDMLGLIPSGVTNSTVIANAIGKMSAGLSAGMSVGDAGASTAASKGSKLSAAAGRAKSSETADRLAASAHASNASAAKLEFGTTATGIVGDVLQTGVPVGSAAGSIDGGGTEMFLVDTTASNSLGKVILRVIQWIPKCYNRYEDYCDEYGYPCNDYYKINTISGYIRCYGASVKDAANASQANLAAINSYLNSGFYYE